MKYRFGIDVGGTNTDAVILDENHQVVAKCKRPTSEDISTGINQAVETVLKESAVAPSAIQHAMLGTTHATNAIVERKQEQRVVQYGPPRARRPRLQAGISFGNLSRRGSSHKHPRTC